MMTMVAPLEVGICCTDLDALLTFYTQVLGFEQVNSVEVPAEKAVQAGLSNGSYRVARLQTPWGERLKLLQPEHAPQVLETTPFLLDRRGSTYLTFIVDDLDFMLNRLVMHGIEPLSGRTKIEVRPGTFLAFCRDPEENVLEFVQYDDIAGYRPDLTATGGDLPRPQPS
jgi:catechol 2,3-dioxygenase-like lactoylglutathione lyase family enzyme